MTPGGAACNDLLAWLSGSPAADPAAPALVEGDRTLSYGELWSRVRRLCRRFEHALGGRPGPIAIAATNSIEYAVALLAGLAAGRAVAEISPQESAERLGAVLDRLRPSVVFTSLDPALFAGLDAAIFDPAAVRDASEAGPDDGAAFADGAPGRTAFIVFTSGTTGLPKGVVLSHGNVRAVTEAILDYLPLTPADRYALVLPLCHTYGKSVLLTSLRAGASVVFDHGFADLPSFVGRLASDGITAFAAVPYHAKLLLARGGLESRDLSRLRWFTISGGPFAAPDLEALAAKIPAARLVFMYGLTETSTRACALLPEDRRGRPGSCGRPIRGVRVRIADENGADAGPGVKGDVLVAGPNVMQGYWNEPDLSARVLADGWLRTGDLGWLDEDGFLYLAGRSSDLIKCAGERISAEEIELVLGAHPGVAEVAVRGVPHPYLGEEPAAWIVPRGGNLDPADLSAHCAGRLVSYKIPRAWYFLDELPRTPSGKIQKHRLVAP